MWIIFGTKAQLERVPGGLKVERRCGSCGENATFYEKQATKTFRLYFIDVYDYERHRVMACGCCGAYYATDELGQPGSNSQNKDLAGQVGGYLEKAGSAVSSGFNELVSGITGRQAPEKRVREEPLKRESHALSDEEMDREIAGIDDDTEARFRALEEKAKKGG